jgi:hypothetical protein
MLQDKDHYLSLKNGMFDETSKEDLNHLFATLATSPQRDKVAIHFHGGLVSMESGLRTAGYVMDALADISVYHIFFIWQSSFLDVLSDRLREIFDERIFRQLLTRLTQFATAKIRQKAGERGGRLELPDEREIRDELRQPKDGQTPFSTINPSDLPQNEKLRKVEQDQFRERLKSDPVLRTETQAIARSLLSPDEINAEEATRGMGARASTHTLMSPSVLDDIRKQAPEPETRGIVTTTLIIERAVEALVQVIKRYAERRDHGVYATVVEELLHRFYLANIGKGIWDTIKEETTNAFGDDPNTYGGTAFLQGLKVHFDSGQRPHITLVGHSAGAIYICHLLKHADVYLPKDAILDVVLLAPACDFQLFSETLQQYGHRIAAIRVFGMSDEVERNDHLVPLVYPHSLLYLVAGIFEKDADMPLVGMQRYYSGEAPYNTAEVLSSCTYLATPQAQRTVWSVVDGGDGLACGARKHGGFYEEAATLKSLRYILSEGFSYGSR